MKKYIGIPYKINGYSFSGVNCYGLIWLIYKNELGIELGKYPHLPQDLREVAVFENYDKEGFELIHIFDLKDFDVVIFAYNNKVNHLGLYYDGRIFHIYNDYSVAEPLSDNFKKRIRYIFRHRKLIKGIQEK